MVKKEKNKRLKKFLITITDIEKGQNVFIAESDCILGAVHHETEQGVGVRQIILTDAPGMVIGMCTAALKDLAKQLNEDNPAVKISELLALAMKAKQEQERGD